MPSLRPAKIRDAKFLLDLKNDPDVRRFAIVSHDKISWSTHIKWLRKHIKDVFIIEVDGLRVGDLRLDEEIAIKLIPEARGLGIATMILKECHGMAKIVDGNYASLIAFKKAGFITTDFNGEYYTVEK